MSPGYSRYCGPGRAVVRVGGESFTIKGGRWYVARRGAGAPAYSGTASATRRPGGFWFLLGGPTRPGRNDIIDGGRGAARGPPLPIPPAVVRPSSRRASRARPSPSEVRRKPRSRAAGHAASRLAGPGSSRESRSATRVRGTARPPGANLVAPNPEIDVCRLRVCAREPPPCLSVAAEFLASHAARMRVGTSVAPSVAPQCGPAAAKEKKPCLQGFLRWAVKDSNLRPWD